MRRHSLSTKLIAIQLFTTLVVVGLVVVAIAVTDSRLVVEQKTAALTSMAQVLGFNSTPALDFMDNEAAQSVLASLRTQAGVRQAVIFDAEGEPFVHYQREDSTVAALEIPTLQASGARLANDHLEIFQAIERDGEQLGTVFLLSDLHELDERRARNLRIISLVMALAAVVALVLAIFTQKAVTQPIRRLVDAMRSISTSEDYSLRVPTERQDELGLLSGEFNKMLAIVGARKRTLREQQEVLEKAVDERTTELESEMSARVEAVAARQQNEVQFRAIVENMLEGLVVVDEDGLVGSFNPAAATMFKVEGEAAVGRHIHQFVARDFEAEPEETLELIGASTGGVTAWKGRRSDGSEFPVELVVSSFELDGQRYLGASVRDVSERQRLDRLKSEFVSTVSHELRTPITSVYGTTKLVLGGVVGEISPEVRRLLEMSQRNSERLIRLLSDLLDMQRIEAGQMQVTFASHDLRTVVASAVDASRGYLAHYQVEMEVTAPDEAVTIVGDAGRLAQVVTNLISNAAKFSPRGQTIEVSLEADAGHATVRVRDHGTGIPEEARDRIFGKFQQADSSDTRQQGGTGLGLAICKALVQQHEGTIDFDSVVGEGSVFWFRLPLAPEADSELADADAGAEAEGRALEAEAAG